MTTTNTAASPEREELEALRCALEDLSIEYGHTKREALELATWLHRTFYSEVVDWKPFDNASSILSQIDNMVAGLRDRLAKAEARHPAPAAGEAVAWMYVENSTPSGRQVRRVRLSETRQAISPEDAAEYQITETPLYAAPPAPTEALGGGWEVGGSGPYSDENKGAISALLNRLGGYQAVFNALAVAAKPNAIGLGLSPMTFAYHLIKHHASDLAASPSPAPLAASGPEAGVNDKAREFLNNWFAPWGSWKTAWWEGEVGDDVEMSDANALKHLTALTTKTKEATDDR